VEWIRQAAGERFASLELNLLLSAVLCTEDRQQAAEERARELAASRGVASRTAGELLADPYWLIGSVDQIVDQLRTMRERYGISYVAVRSHDLEAFAPVVARLAGM